MNLVSPLIITPGFIVTPWGRTVTVRPFTLTELDITFIDNAKRRTVHAQVARIPRPLILWQGDAYDAIGDWTQEQAEARVTELLGEDPAATLAALFQRQP